MTCIEQERYVLILQSVRITTMSSFLLHDMIGVIKENHAKCNNLPSIEFMGKYCKIICGFDLNHSHLYLKAMYSRYVSHYEKAHDV